MKFFLFQVFQLDRSNESKTSIFQGFLAKIIFQNTKGDFILTLNSA